MSAPEFQQVRDTLLADLHSAFESWYSGDTEPYAGRFADEFTYFDPLGVGRLTRREQLHERYAPLQGNIDLPRFEVLEPILQMFGETAVLTFLLRQYDHDGPTGPTWTTTEVFRPIDGAWRIVHAHWSIVPEEQSA